MSALPKHKISHMRQGKRRRTIKMTAIATVECKNCHQPKLSHHACPHCGTV